MRTLLLTCLCLVAVSVAALAADIAGWGATRWNMSIDDIKRAYPDFTIGKDGFGFTAGRVADVSVGDATFKVYLQFAGIGGQRRTGSTEPVPPESTWRLNRVELHGPENACYHANEVLLGKYGPPAKVDGNLTLWILPTTTIRLLRPSYSPECEIIYHPTDKGNSL